jgi:hypothetical protein
MFGVETAFGAGCSGGGLVTDGWRLLLPAGEAFTSGVREAYARGECSGTFAH